MINIECDIPKILPEVSKYIIGILEDRLHVKFQVKLHDELFYKFSFSQESFTLPSYFIKNECDKFLSKRSKFEYKLENVDVVDKTINGLVPTDERKRMKELHSFEIDIIGTIFVLLSRYEEYVLEEHCFDSFGRLLPEYAINNHKLDTPIVDELIVLLNKILELRFNVKVPETNIEFSILPSHDVDRPFEYYYYSKRQLIKRICGDIIVRKSPKSAIKRFQLYNGVKSGNLEIDPFNTFNWLLKQSTKHNRISTFHFITQSTFKKFDQDYNLKNPEILNLLSLINNTGHQIALHPSFNASVIQGQTAKEFNTLKKVCDELNIKQDYFKSRYHYLRWNINCITELEQASIDIDQTLTFAQYPGFKCGTSIPFKAFNFSTLCTSELIIEPLILMEQSLFSDNYLGLKKQKADAWNIVDDLKRACKKHSGNFTVLWHNSELFDSEMKDFYVECIK